MVKLANSVIPMNHSQATPASSFNASTCIVFFLFKGCYLQFDQSKLSWNHEFIRTISIPVRWKGVLGRCDEPSPSIVLGDCDCVTNRISMGLRFSFLDRWSLSISVVAWAEEISPEVCEECLTTSSSVGLGRAELLSNCGRYKRE